MRRSGYVAAPLLASAAFGLLAEGRKPVRSARRLQCVQRAEQTRFAGFGTTFQEHPLAWAFAGTLALMMWRGPRAGG